MNKKDAFFKQLSRINMFAWLLCGKFLIQPFFYFPWDSAQITIWLSIFIEVLIGAAGSALLWRKQKLSYYFLFFISVMMYFIHRALLDRGVYALALDDFLTGRARFSHTLFSMGWAAVADTIFYGFFVPLLFSFSIIYYFCYFLLARRAVR
jgi:hypothetical protein